MGLSQLATLTNCLLLSYARLSLSHVATANELIEPLLISFLKAIILPLTCERGHFFKAR